MAVLTSTNCKKAMGRLTYIFNEGPHSTKLVTDRCLSADGQNIKLVKNPKNGGISKYQNGRYLERQYLRVLAGAKNSKDRLNGSKPQIVSIIISFDHDEFDISRGNANLQIKNALKLVKSYAEKRFGKDAQFICCVQCDNESAHLHVHLLVNTIKVTGKCVQTNLFTVSAQRKALNLFLRHEFQNITGRKWQNAFNDNRKDIGSLPTRSTWELKLKQIINETKNEVDNFNEFCNRLNKQGVSVILHKKDSITYQIRFKGKTRKRRAFYQVERNGKVVKTTGLGRNYTKESLELLWEQKKKH